MGRGEPCVKGPHGDLYRKGQCKSPKDPHLIAETVMVRHQLRDEERAGCHIKRDDGNKEKDASDEGVEKKFDGCIVFTGTAPYSDDQVHGNQHRFPEDKEKNRI